ncbi:MAG: hypothetical protein N4A38_04650 [Candidatus Gracilibacteria bacterium]|nr:hypothetical protein [Candidatus Gracilibacteria bacterium]
MSGTNTLNEGGNTNAEKKTALKGLEPMLQPLENNNRNISSNDFKDIHYCIRKISDVKRQVSGRPELMKEVNVYEVRLLTVVNRTRDILKTYDDDGVLDDKEKGVLKFLEDFLNSLDKLSAEKTVIREEIKQEIASLREAVKAGNKVESVIKSPEKIREGDIITHEEYYRDPKKYDSDETTESVTEVGESESDIKVEGNNIFVKFSDGTKVRINSADKYSHTGKEEAKYKIDPDGLFNSYDLTPETLNQKLYVGDEWQHAREEDDDFYIRARIPVKGGKEGEMHLKSIINVERLEDGTLKIEPTRYFDEFYNHEQNAINNESDEVSNAKKFSDLIRKDLPKEQVLVALKSNPEVANKNIVDVFKADLDFMNHRAVSNVEINSVEDIFDLVKNDVNPDKKDSLYALINKILEKDEGRIYVEGYGIVGTSPLNKYQGGNKQAGEIQGDIERIKELEKAKEEIKKTGKLAVERGDILPEDEESFTDYFYDRFVKDGWNFLFTAPKAGVGAFKELGQWVSEDGERKLDIGIGLAGVDGEGVTGGPVGICSYKPFDKTGFWVSVGLLSAGIGVTHETSKYEKVSFGLQAILRAMFDGEFFLGATVSKKRDLAALEKAINEGKKVIESLSFDNNGEVKDIKFSKELWMGNPHIKILLNKEEVKEKLIHKINYDANSVLEKLTEEEKNDLQIKENIYNGIAKYIVSGEISHLKTIEKDLPKTRINGWFLGAGFGAIPVVVGVHFDKFDSNREITQDEANRVALEIANGRDIEDGALYVDVNENGGVDNFNLDNILERIKKELELKNLDNLELVIYKSRNISGKFDNETHEVVITDEIKAKETTILGQGKMKVIYFIYKQDEDIADVRRYATALRVKWTKKDGFVVGEDFNNAGRIGDGEKEANVKSDRIENIENDLGFKEVFNSDLSKKVAKLKLDKIDRIDKYSFDSEKRTDDKDLQYAISEYFSMFNESELGETKGLIDREKFEKILDMLSNVDIFKGIIGEIKKLKETEKEEEYVEALVLFINRVGDEFLNVEEIERAKGGNSMFRTYGKAFDLNWKGSKKYEGNIKHKLPDAVELGIYAGLIDDTNEKYLKDGRVDWTKLKVKENREKDSNFNIEELVRYLVTRELYDVPSTKRGKRLGSRFESAIKQFNELGLSWRGASLEDKKGYIDLVKNIQEPKQENNILGFTVADHVSLDEQGKGLMPIFGSAKFLSTNKIENISENDKNKMLENLSNKGALKAVNLMVEGILGTTFTSLTDEERKEAVKSILTTGRYDNDEHNIHMQLDADYYEGLMGMSASMSIFMKNLRITGNVGAKSLGIMHIDAVQDALIPSRVTNRVNSWISSLGGGYAPNDSASGGDSKSNDPETPPSTPSGGNTGGGNAGSGNTPPPPGP